MAIKEIEWIQEDDLREEVAICEEIEGYISDIKRLMMQLRDVEQEDVDEMFAETEHAITSRLTSAEARLKSLNEAIDRAEQREYWSQVL